MCVLNVVMYRWSGFNSSWWYPVRKSSLLNLAPFRSVISSLTVGVGCLSRCMTLFALCMSTQSLVAPKSLFGGVTVWDTQSVGSLLPSQWYLHPEVSWSPSLLSPASEMALGVVFVLPVWRFHQFKAWLLAPSAFLSLKVVSVFFLTGMFDMLFTM